MDYEVEISPKRIEIKYKLPTGKLPAYPQERTVTESYEYCTTMYCPNCGNQGIWIGPDEDSAWGSDHVCVACKSAFSMPNGPDYAEAAVVAELIKETP